MFVKPPWWRDYQCKCGGREELEGRKEGTGRKEGRKELEGGEKRNEVEVHERMLGCLFLLCI